MTRGQRYDEEACQQGARASAGCGCRRLYHLVYWEGKGVGVRKTESEVPIQEQGQGRHTWKGMGMTHKVSG